jgi:hypothetical protein
LCPGDFPAGERLGTVASVRFSLLRITVALALLTGACSSTEADPSGELTPSNNTRQQFSEVSKEDGGEPDWTGAQLNPYDLRAGQCFSEWSWFDTEFDRRINITAAVGCAEPHKREVFYEAEFPAPNGAPFPGETKMTEWSTDLCYDAFADFVGTEYELSIYGIDFIQPTRETFEHPVGRHRRVTCIIYHIDGDDLEGSAQQSAI